MSKFAQSEFWIKYIFIIIYFLGSGSASARIGAMLTPYIAQVLLKTSLYSAISVYSVIGKSLVLDVLIQLQQNLDTSKDYSF